MLMGTRFAAVAGLLWLMPVAPLAAQESGGAMTPAEQRELAGYRLTMDNVKKAAAAGAKIQVLEKDPQMKAMMESREAISITDAIKKLNDFPQARAAIDASGLSAKDFMFTVIELGYTAVAVRLQGMGGEAAKGVAKLPTSPENVAFYAAHQAEIEPLLAKMRGADAGDEE